MITERTITLLECMDWRALRPTLDFAPPVIRYWICDNPDCHEHNDSCADEPTAWCPFCEWAWGWSDVEHYDVLPVVEDDALPVAAA